MRRSPKYILVDLRLQEFRMFDWGTNRILVIPFDSPTGKRLFHAWVHMGCTRQEFIVSKVQ